MQKSITVLVLFSSLFVVAASGDAVEPDEDSYRRISVAEYRDKMKAAGSGRLQASRLAGLPRKCGLMQSSLRTACRFGDPS